MLLADCEALLPGVEALHGFLAEEWMSCYANRIGALAPCVRPRRGPVGSRLHPLRRALDRPGGARWVLLAECEAPLPSGGAGFRTA